MLTGPRSLDTFSPLHGHGFVLNHPKDAGILGGSDKQKDTPAKVKRTVDWDKEIEALKERTGSTADAKDRRAMDITVNVGYTENLDRVVMTVKRVLRETELILKKPEPEMNIGNADPANIQVTVKPWVAKDSYWDAMSCLVRNLKMALYKEGITYRSVKSNN